PREICQRRIEPKRLRGANQVAIIAKAARLVLSNRGRPGFIAIRTWRWYARCQAGNRSTHRVADPYAGVQRDKILAAAIGANYRGAGTRATDCTGGSRSAAVLRDDRSAAGIGGGTGDFAGWNCERGADAARISMHLFGAGKPDAMGGRRQV